MYLEFYRLKRAPFHITPDPTLLFLSASHKAALGAIAYGIEARQGFVAITGDVGVGKTTMLRAYLTRVDPQQLKTIFLLHAHLSFVELLTRMFRSFGVQVETDDPAVLVTQMQQLLRQEYAQGRNVALIIDEAQHLPLETLEQLRLLSNLTTAGEHPLQIVLVGQPELAQHLQRRALHRLAQRLVIRATIVPLTTAESLAYIRHRVAKVALPGGPIFTPGALKAIVRHAHGVPRVINILCTNVLLAGFGAQQQPITAGLAQQVIAAFTGVQPFPLGRVGLAASAGLVLVAGLLWVGPFRPGPPPTRPSPAARVHPGPEAPRRASAPPRVPPSLQQPGPTPQARAEPATDRAFAQGPDAGHLRLLPLESPERQRPETPRVPSLSAFSTTDMPSALGRQDGHGPPPTARARPSGVEAGGAHQGTPPPRPAAQGVRREAPPRPRDATERGGPRGRPPRRPPALRRPEAIPSPVRPVHAFGASTGASTRQPEAGNRPGRAPGRLGVFAPGPAPEVEDPWNRRIVDEGGSE